jgi:hypothetical protein
MSADGRTTVIKTYQQIAAELGELVQRKNAAYGNSVDAGDRIMAILYPAGITPQRMPRALRLVRILDKVNRYATDNDSFGESPLIDVAGYCITILHEEQKESAEECTHVNASDPAANNSPQAPRASAAPSTSEKTTTSASATSERSSTSSCCKRSNASSAAEPMYSSPAPVVRRRFLCSTEAVPAAQRDVRYICSICGHDVRLYPEVFNIFVTNYWSPICMCCMKGEAAAKAALTQEVAL